MKDFKVKFIMGPPECNDPNIPDYSKQFIEDFSNVANLNITYGDIEEIAEQSLTVFFIGSGGAEISFNENYQKVKEPYILLTTPAYNSLPSAMEIMGFLQEHNLKGEILHGDMKQMADRLNVLLKVADAKAKLSKQILGCFGQPGGLIASNADIKALNDKYGIKLQVFTLDELIDEYKKGGYPENEYTKQLLAKSFNNEETIKALNVYGALKRLISKYNLTAVSVRCFDLLKTIQTTGCLALAILNAEGIPAACEGDQKTLLSMVISYLLTGQSSFMANPSCMDTKANEIIYAHCTIPMDMVDDYKLMTHFESNIGVAISCDIEPQKMTIFKCNGDLSNYHAEMAELLETMHRTNLCRSQMRLHLPNGCDYFCKNPISNHHLIIKGDYTSLFDEFFSQLKTI